MNKKLKPFIFFGCCVVISLLALGIGYFGTKTGNIPSIFQQAPYPSGGSGCTDEGEWWNCHRCDLNCEGSDCSKCEGHGGTCQTNNFDALEIANWQNENISNYRILGIANAQDTPQSDPWCCGDDDDDDDDDDTSPTPTPTSSFSCTGLDPQPEDVNIGDELTFTCQGTSTNTTLTTINFRVLDKNGAIIDTQTKSLTSGVKNAQFTFTVPDTASVASFRAQCQVCKTGGTCTSWGQAN